MTRFVTHIALLSCFAVASPAFGDSLQRHFINVSGTATGAGTVTCTLTEKAPGTDEIGSFSYTAANGDSRGTVATGLKDDFDINGYSAVKMSRSKDDGTLHSVIKVEAKRGKGVAFVLSCTEDIPGIVVGTKDESGLCAFNLENDTILRGFSNDFVLTGIGTTWLSDNVSALSFGDGVQVNSFQVDSDSQITANITVSCSAPSGIETVGVIGDGDEEEITGLICVSAVPLGFPECDTEPFCPAACCFGDKGQCVDLPTDECTQAGGVPHCDKSCAIVIAEGTCVGAIPAVSEWGLLITALLGLAAGTVVIMRRRRMLAGA